MVSVEVKGADGSFKTYDLQKKPRPRRRPRRRKPVIKDVVVEVDTGPATWKDVDAWEFDPGDDRQAFAVDEFDFSDSEYEAIVSAQDRISDREEPRLLMSRELGRENRRAQRSAKRRGKLPVFDLAGRLIGSVPCRASTHKMGNPSGRKLRRIKRKTVRHMPQVEPMTFESDLEYWLREVPYPDMGMVSQHALEVEESMIFAAEYTDDVAYLESIMLPLDELVEEAA